jgi:hypothetical protein
MDEDVIPEVMPRVVSRRLYKFLSSGITQISSHNTTPTSTISTLRRRHRCTLEENVRNGLNILPVDVHTGGADNVNRILLAISIAAAPIVKESPNHPVVQEQVRGSADSLEQGHAAG